MTAEADKTDEQRWQDTKPALIRMALELTPLLVFFVCTSFGEGWLARSELLRSLFSSPIIFATAPFMVTMVICLLISWLMFKRVAVMPLVTLVVVLIFGTLTLWLQDSTFIKIKPTIVNTLFGGTLLVGLLFRQSLLRYVFGEVYQLQPKGWQVLTVRWGVFFLGLAVLNEIAWRGSTQFFSDPVAGDSFYAGFKLWAVMPLTLVFSILQLPLLKQYAPEPDDTVPMPVLPPTT